MKKIVEITKDLGCIPMAHRLMYHNGNCRLLHGHNYGLKMTLALLEGDINPHTGMVTDFDLFKKFKGILEDQYDHCAIFHENDPVAVVLDAHQKETGTIKIVRIKQHPTVEVIAGLWGDLINKLIERENGSLVLKKIVVHETPTSSCEITY